MVTSGKPPQPGNSGSDVVIGLLVICVIVVGLTFVAKESPEPDKQADQISQVAGFEEPRPFLCKLATTDLSAFEAADNRKLVAKIGLKSFDRANALRRPAAVTMALDNACDKLEYFDVSEASTSEEIRWFGDCQNGSRMNVNEAMAISIIDANKESIERISSAEGVKSLQAECAAVSGASIDAPSAAALDPNERTSENTDRTLFAETALAACEKLVRLNYHEVDEQSFVRGKPENFEGSRWRFKASLSGQTRPGILVDSKYVCEVAGAYIVSLKITTKRAISENILNPVNIWTATKR